MPRYKMESCRLLRVVGVFCSTHILMELYGIILRWRLTLLSLYFDYLSFTDVYVPRLVQQYNLISCDLPNVLHVILLDLIFAYLLYIEKELVTINPLNYRPTKRACRLRHIWNKTAQHSFDHLYRYFDFPVNNVTSYSVV